MKRINWILLGGIIFLLSSCTQWSNDRHRDMKAPHKPGPFFSDTIMPHRYGAVQAKGVGIASITPPGNATLPLTFAMSSDLSPDVYVFVYFDAPSAQNTTVTIWDKTTQTDVQTFSNTTGQLQPASNYIFAEYGGFIPTHIYSITSSLAAAGNFVVSAPINDPNGPDYGYDITTYSDATGNNRAIIVIQDYTMDPW